MTKKLFVLIASLVGAAATAAIAIVTYCNPPFATQINTAIPIAATAVTDILALFAPVGGGKKDV